MALALSARLLLLVACADGHGLLKFPESRNSIRFQEAQWCQHCGQGHGPGPIASRIAADPNANAFPDLYPAEHTHGLCGDPFQTTNYPADAEGMLFGLPSIKHQRFMAPGGVPSASVFRQGQTIDVQMVITANHKGFFQFSVCDEGLSQSTPSQQAGQLCLDRHILRRVDPATRPECIGQQVGNNPETTDCQPLDTSHPGRWYLPPNPLGLANDLDNLGGVRFSIKLQLPADLACEKCTLQWWWLSGNSCHPQGLISYYADFAAQHPEFLQGAWNGFQDQYMSECGLSAQGEQFWNCADITIEGAAPATTEATTSTTKVTTSTTEATTSTTEATTSTTEATTTTQCAADFGSCSASGCCASEDFACVRRDLLYAECRPAGDCPASWLGCPAEPCADLVKEFGNCRASHCCEAGLVCFEEDARHAECRRPDWQCPSCAGWSCEQLRPLPATTSTTAAHTTAVTTSTTAAATTTEEPCASPRQHLASCHDNGHCCLGGLACVNRVPGWLSQCLAPGECKPEDGWSCDIMLPTR